VAGRALTDSLSVMQTLDVIDAVKKRLQDQQSKLEKDSSFIYRAELDALWACVEVLAQAIDGHKDIVVPDYFSDPQIRVRSTVRLDK
jgi:hypothetical protein